MTRGQTEGEQSRKKGNLVGFPFPVCSFASDKDFSLLGPSPLYFDYPCHPLCPLLTSTPDLKRFSESRIRTSKLTTFVNFPLRDLDLREFASENTSEYFQLGGRNQGASA